MGKRKNLYVVSKSIHGIVSVVAVYKNKDDALLAVAEGNVRFLPYYYVTTVPYVK